MPVDDNNFRKFHFTSPNIVDRRWLEWFREEYGRKFAKVEFDLASDVPPHLRLSTRVAHGLSIATMSLSPLHSRNLVGRATDDDLVLGLPLKGAVTVRFGGEEVALGASKIVVLSNDILHDLTCRVPVEGFALRLQRRLLEQLVPNLSDAVTRTIERNSLPMRLLLSYLLTLDAEEEVASPEARHMVVTHICDLLALAIGASRDTSAVAEGRGLRAARLAAVKADILDKLGDADLSAASLAARHKVTPRYVHMLFETEGVTFSEFVIGQRLARAHKRLADPRFANQPISKIAFDVGFSDLSHFNRTFRRRYGATPSDVRERARREGGADS
jgi:AraC-like DNA-binding protein